MKNLRVLIISLILVFSVGFIGSLSMKDESNSSWYNENKHPITPPNIVFPVVWTILYTLIAIALFFSWIKSHKKYKKLLAFIYASNLYFNAIWPYLFFQLKNPLIAFVDLSFIILTLIAIMLINRKIDKRINYLLIPYLAWVLFAAFLNFYFL